jgi:putative peptidoglycan lipid II flippase
VLLAGVLQLLFQLPFLGHLGLLPRPRFAPKDEGVRRIIKLMIPALFGVSVTQLNLLLDTLIASFLTAGSISWLYYSDRLMEFPLGILGVALGTVILPNLSRKHAKSDAEAFSSTLDWALRWVLLFGLPSAIGLMVLAGPMMATLFYSGNFTAADVQMATQSLWAYSLGLVAFMAIKVLAPGFYSRQDTKTPVRIAVIAMFANMALNLALMLPLAHAGLALATTLSACLNATLLWRGLRRDGAYRPSAGWPLLLLRGAAASLLMGLALWWGTSDMAAWLNADSWERVARLLTWILIGIVVYFAALLASGVRPRHFLRGLQETGEKSV